MVIPKCLPIKKNDSSIKFGHIPINFFALPDTKYPQFFGTVMAYCGQPSTPSETIPILLTKNIL